MKSLLIQILIALVITIAFGITPYEDGSVRIPLPAGKYIGICLAADWNDYICD